MVLGAGGGGTDGGRSGGGACFGAGIPTFDVWGLYVGAIPGGAAGGCIIGGGAFPGGGPAGIIIPGGFAIGGDRGHATCGGCAIKSTSSCFAIFFIILTSSR